MRELGFPSASNSPCIEWTTQSAAAQLPPAIVSLLKWIKLQLPSLDFNDVLPIGVDVTKGLIIAGNHATPNLLVAEFSKSEGWYGTTQARSKLDLYRQTMTLHFHSPIIRFVQNEDYAQPMNTLGEGVRQKAAEYDRPCPLLPDLTDSSLQEREVCTCMHEFSVPRSSWVHEALALAEATLFRKLEISQPPSTAFVRTALPSPRSEERSG